MVAPAFQGHVLGDYTQANWPKTVELSHHYFMERGILLDLRGNVHISKESIWGFCVKVYSATHNFAGGKYQPEMKLKSIFVKEGAFIGSEAVLYNCTVGKNAIVALGSVVRTMIVPEHTCVEGNPARVMAEWDGERWKRVRKIF